MRTKKPAKLPAALSAASKPFDRWRKRHRPRQRLPQELEVILANCLSHGRRRFVEVAINFPQECLYVLEVLKEVSAGCPGTIEIRSKNPKPPEKFKFFSSLPKAHVFTKTGHYYYTHYYAIQAMVQAGDEEYAEWYPEIRDALVEKQSKNGAWPAERAGTTPSTTMAVLILGTPHRFIPIYQR